MTDEELQPVEIPLDDVDALRVLLHNVRGLSAISTSEPLTLDEE
jgi:hypothetical protein